MDDSRGLSNAQIQKLILLNKSRDIFCKKCRFLADAATKKEDIKCLVGGVISLKSNKKANNKDRKFRLRCWIQEKSHWRFQKQKSPADCSLKHFLIIWLRWFFQFQTNKFFLWKFMLDVRLALVEGKICSLETFFAFDWQI